MFLVNLPCGLNIRQYYSQLAVSDWYDILSVNTTAADAILDRIVHTAQRFVLEGDTLRKNEIVL